MGRLKRPPPMVATLSPRLGAPPVTAAAVEQKRTAENPLRRLYKLKRWQDIRIATFERDMFVCQCGDASCGVFEPDTSKLVCDHATPHRGDEAKFWAGPFQTLLKACHDRKKQREEQASLHQRGTWY